VSSNPIYENRTTNKVLTNENAVASLEQRIEKGKTKAKTRRSIACCAIWCSESDQTQHQTCVPVHLPELPENASHDWHQIT